MPASRRRSPINPKIEIAATEDAHWDTATSERIAGQLYARFAATGGLDLVYGMADNQAIAAMKAAQAAGIAVGEGQKKLALVGGNCLKEGIDAIKAGDMYATLSQIPTDLGIKEADAVNDYFAGKTLPKNDLLPVEMITKANVGQWQAAVHLLSTAGLCKSFGAESVRSRTFRSRLRRERFTRSAAKTAPARVRSSSS